MIGVRAMRRGGGILVGMALSAMLGGCGAGGTPGFEAANQSTGYSLSALSSKLGNLVSFNTIFPNEAPLPQTGTPIECPTVDVLDGTASYRAYSGAGQSNDSVRYGFSLGDVARECSRSGDQIVLKVGAEGRLLIGPAGSAGNYSVPIRVAVRNENTQKVVFSRVARVSATVAPTEAGAGFTYVTEPFTVPLVAHPNEDYTILVGFDPSGAGIGAEKPVRKKPRA